jgi:hypothetical protein
MRTKIMLKRPSIPLLGSILTAVLLLVLIPLSAPAYAEESEAECWAVIVGVSEYQSIEDLDYADDGARELYELLSPAWGEEHIKLLIDREATKAAIRRAIEWMASNEDADDTVLFYFSGHSDPDGYMAPYDAYYEGTWISSRELRNWLRPLDSARITIILDTCHAGKFETNLSDTGRVVLMSSQGNEPSWETGDLKNGVFTYYLLEAFGEFSDSDLNLDFELSAEEIFEYAKPKTIEETSYLKETQHPVLSDQFPDELSLLMKLVIDVGPAIPSGLNILILDNEEYSSFPLELTLAPGSVHDLTVVSPLNAGSGTRYVFTSWDDGHAAASRTISQGGSYTANCQKQFELVIESAFGAPDGGGWYDTASTAVISVASVEEPTTKHIFTGWSGDYSGTAATASLTMNSPKTITANWRTEYLLTIETAYGQPEGADWYESGSTTTISVAPSVGFGIRHIFTGWSGDLSATTPTTTLVMDSPIAVTANWRTDFTQLYIIIGAVIVVGGVVFIVIKKKRA